MAPLLLIIYNLLLADIQQAFAFTLSIVWLRDDAIHSAPSRVCWAQAWFLTIGKLASCGFLAAISANTYLAVVRGRRPPQWAVYLATAAIWVFAHAMTISGVLATENGRPVGGYYVRAGAWVSPCLFLPLVQSATEKATTEMGNGGLFC